MERVKNERNKAEQIEMNGPRRGPAAHKNEQADEKIEKRQNAEDIPDESGLFRGGGDDIGIEWHAAARKLIRHARPDARPPELLRHLSRAVNGNPVHRHHNVARVDSSLRGGRS